MCIPDEYEDGRSPIPAFEAAIANVLPVWTSLVSRLAW
jgi:hypothetical protein